MTSGLNMSDDEFIEKMDNGEFDEQLQEPIAGDVAEVVEEPEPVNEDNVEINLEQPVTDSSDVSNDDKIEDDVKEDPTEAEEDGADHAEPDDDGKSTDTEDEIKTSADDVLTEYLKSKSKVRASGAEFEFTNQEKLDSFDKIYQQAIDYTKKTQAIAPHRKRIAAMEELGVTDDQFNTLMDVLKGDKDAVTAVIKQAGIDTLELDTDAELNYVPNSYGKSDKELDIDEVFKDLSTTPKGDVTTDIVGRQWDDRSRNEIVDGIQLANGTKLETKDIIMGLQDDVTSGRYDKVLPEMLKLKHLDGARQSDISYYMQAGAQQIQSEYQESMAQQRAEQEAATRAQAEAKLIAETKAKQKAEEEAKAIAAKKKAAGVSQGATGTTKATDYLDMNAMSDEEFMAFMDKQIG